MSAAHRPYHVVCTSISSEYRLKSIGCIAMLIYLSGFSPSFSSWLAWDSGVERSAGRTWGAVVRLAGLPAGSCAARRWRPACREVMAALGLPGGRGWMLWISSEAAGGFSRTIRRRRLGRQPQVLADDGGVSNVVPFSRHRHCRSRQRFVLLYHTITQVSPTMAISTCLKSHAPT